jgi:hypothetical protein
VGTTFTQGEKIRLNVMGGDLDALTQIGTATNERSQSGILLTFTLPADPSDPTTTEIPGIDIFITAQQIIQFSDMLGMDDFDCEA